MTTPEKLTKAAKAPAIATALLLLVPFIAMQITDEVDWDETDFIVMGALLFGACGAFELAARTTRNHAYRAAVGVAVAVGVLFGWRWVLAPLLGWVMLTWLLSSLRVLGKDARAPGMPDEEVVATPVSTSERTLFWCEECGTEVLLLVRGTARAPSHCGQRMHERTEILS
jgi:hypothetical protein